MQEPWQREWRDYYTILESKPDATLKQLRSAYRRLARRYHPDVSGSDGERFKLIAEAYEVLSDAERRRAYDAAYQRVKHDLPPEDRVHVEPASVEVRTPSRRSVVQVEAIIRFDALPDDVATSPVLDVSCFDPDVTVQHVNAEWSSPRPATALRVRTTIAVNGKSRRVGLIYRIGRHAALQRVDVHMPRFAAYTTVATPRGVRTYALGLKWLDVGLERTILFPFAAFLSTLFGSLSLSEHGHHGLSQLAAIGGTLVTLAIVLVLANAYFATHAARYQIRRFLPVVGFIVLARVAIEVLNALH